MHGKCTLTPTNAPIHSPIVSFSCYYEMKIVSVLLLQNQKHDVSVNGR